MLVHIHTHSCSRPRSMTSALGGVHGQVIRGGVFQQLSNYGPDVWDPIEDRTYSWGPAYNIYIYIICVYDRVYG